MSLVEIVLVFLLIMTTIAMVLPALQTHRHHDSSRAQSNNNLRQCVLAVHTFHDTYRRLPDAFDVGGSYQQEPKTLWFHLLPYVEADDVYKQGLATAVVSAFIAPADPFNDDSTGRLNFAVNLRLFALGTLTAQRCNAVGEALAIPEAGTRLKSNLTLPRIVDGTSNVLMMATRYAVCDGKVTRYAAEPAEFGGYFGAGTHSKPPSSAGSDADLMYQIMPDNERRSRKKCNPAPGIYGHAFRAGGMSTALADGTVRNIAPTISVTTFTRALCPGDNTPLGTDWVEN